MPHPIDARAIPQSLTTKETTIPDGLYLGARCVDNAGTEYEYVRAAGTINQYDAVVITYAGLASALTTTNAGAIPQKVGVAQVSAATNDYFWVARKGPMTLNVLASCLKDVKIYTTATAGAVDDTATTLIAGLVFTANNGGSTAAVAAYAVDDLTVN